MRTDDINDLARFLGELQSESDRGLALVGASVLDDKLRATLGAFFVECNAAQRLLEHANAPLGTFSARADTCLALGLIDQGEHEEISLIRKVRNEFAHGLHGTAFKSEPIRGYCSSLKSLLPEGAGHPTTDPRFRFINAVVSLVSRLYYRPEWVAKERRALKEWVNSEQVRWRSFESEPPPAGGPVLAIAKVGPPPD
jgi:mannitol operon repressor